MKGKIIKKLCAVSLSVVMLLVAAAANLVPKFSEGLSVSAAETTADGNYEYEVNEDGSVTITKYKGSDTKVVIPSTIGGKKVTSIGATAFSSCTSLTSVKITDSVTSIGTGAFYECTSLTSVTIPDSVTSIAWYAFYGCYSLKDIIIPRNVTSIEPFTFSECTNLSSVIISNNVTSIGFKAFFGCHSLCSITIPDSVTNIGDGAFCYCNNLADKNGFVIVKDVLYHYCGNDKQVTIPDGVTRIGYMAFYSCYSLTSIIIPNSVKSIGVSAFGGCGSLTSITIPDSVTSIEGTAFCACFNLINIFITDSVTSIGEAAFYNCSNLTSITIPANITYINNNAFYGCESLTSIKIPDGITSIGISAFEGCRGLTSITIPDSVTSIENHAFYRCTSLISVTIPDSVTSIGKYTFESCGKLTIKGKKSSYAETYANENNIPFKAITFPLSNKSTISANSVIMGKSITVNCAAKDGTAPYTFAVLYRKAGTSKWTTAQSFKANTSVKITPKAAVNYEIRVSVKDASGEIVRKDMILTVKKPLANSSKLNLETIKLGEKVKVRCFAENGETPYTFSVLYKKTSSTKWTNLAVNSTKNIFLLKPGSAAKYDICVIARSADGQSAKKTLTLTVTK